MGFTSAFKIQMAARHLECGGIISYPTEAVYGLGCDPLNEHAVMTLLRIKQRPIEKGLILIAANIEQLEPYLQLDNTLRQRIQATWPGPVTWVVPAQSGVPEWITGDHTTIAVRVSAHPVVQQLCQTYGGAIISTSANISTQPSCTTKLALLKTFNDKNIFMLHGALGSQLQETAIYDAVSGQQLR